MPAEALPRHRVDVVYDQVHIPLCQEFKTGPLWKDHTEQGMGIFNTTFLPAAHGITIVNMWALFSIYASFQRLRAAKLDTPVCKDRMEEEMKIGIQTFFEPVENRTDRSSRAAVHQVGKEQLFLAQVEREEYPF